MTTNQINYWKLQEEKRTNLANEDIGRRNASTKEKEAAVSYFKAPFEAADKFGSTVEHFGGALDKTTKSLGNIGKLVSALFA